MRSPFPGMDPWLERSDLWPDVHNGLIAALRLHIAPLLRPRYYVRIEERTYIADASDLLLVGLPDMSVHARQRANTSQMPSSESGLATAGIAVQVPLPEEVHETYLEIRDVQQGDLISALEILSPANKQGVGREFYMRKRLAVLGSLSHLVEIDLVRAGAAMPMMGSPPASDYRILVSRSERRPEARLFPFSMRDPVPRLRVPLRHPDETSPELDLGQILNELYEGAGYDLMTDYTREPMPPLSEPDRVWADEILRKAGFR